MARFLIKVVNDGDRQRLVRWMQQSPAGSIVEVKPPKRSLPQNDLMWQRLTEISLRVDWHGQKLSPTDWKDIFTASLKKARVVPNIEGDGFVLLGLRTSEMTTEELSNLLDLMDAFAAQHGVVFQA